MSGWQSGLCAAFLLSELLLTAGCHTAPMPTPEQTAQKFVEYVASGRVDDAYALLGDSYRARCNRDCFLRLAKAQQADAQRLRDAQPATPTRATHTTEVQLRDGSVLRLQEDPASAPSQPFSGKSEPGAVAMRFAQNPLDFYPQATPEQTVRSFVQAVQARRYDVLLQFVPSSLRESLTEAALRERFEGPTRALMESQLTALRAHWTEPFVIDGNVAKLPVGDGQEARLVLEDGQWRVQQLQ